ERVRGGTITPPELSGGTFTVSSLGVRRFTTIVTPGQAAALAVGAVEERVAVVDGQALVRHQLEATLVCDHRILYAADAAAFLGTLRAFLGNPTRFAAYSASGVARARRALRPPGRASVRPPGAG